LRLYANARIPIYWIVNLQERQIEVYTEPIGEEEQASYQQQKIYQEVDSLPLTIDDKQLGKLKVRDLLS
jgi:Uma2 family endonuclease